MKITEKLDNLQGLKELMEISYTMDFKSGFIARSLFECWGRLVNPNKQCKHAFLEVSSAITDIGVFHNSISSFGDLICGVGNSIHSDLDNIQECIAFIYLTIDMYASNIPSYRGMLESVYSHKTDEFDEDLKYQAEVLISAARMADHCLGVIAGYYDALLKLIKTY